MPLQGRQVSPTLLCLSQTRHRLWPQCVRLWGLWERRTRGCHQGEERTNGESPECYQKGMQLQEKQLQEELLHLPRLRVRVRPFALPLQWMLQLWRSSTPAHSSAERATQKFRVQKTKEALLKNDGLSLSAAPSLISLRIVTSFISQIEHSIPIVTALIQFSLLIKAVLTLLVAEDAYICSGLQL